MIIFPYENNNGLISPISEIEFKRNSCWHKCCIRIELPIIW
jgi:hypothetical protein